jgi:hypothetical protein
MTISELIVGEDIFAELLKKRNFFLFHINNCTFAHDFCNKN